MVFLRFWGKPGRPSTVAVMKTDGTGYRELLRDDPQGTLFGWQDSPSDWSGELLNWSWDNRWLVGVSNNRKGGGRLWTVSVADGKRRELASVESGSLVHAAFSPDGRLAFIRYGDFSLMFTLGAPGYTTAAGALVYSAVKPGGLNDVYLASLDGDGHLGGWRRLELRGGSVDTPQPSFSPDGKQIAYVAKDPEQVGGEILILRDLTTGQERVLHRSSGDLNCHCAAQHPKVFCTDTAAAKTDLISLDLDSGEVTRIASFPGFRAVMYPSRDDEALYLFQITSPESEIAQITRWEIASRQETVVVPPSDARKWGSAIPSPDDRWRIQTRDGNLQIQPMSGGDWRTLASINKVAGGQYFVTPDGNWVLYHDTDSSGTHGLFRVSIGGGPPQRMGDFPSNRFECCLLKISPDGHQIMAHIWDPNRYDLWVLENFVPSAKQ